MNNVVEMPDKALQTSPNTENLVLDVQAMNHMMNVANFMAGGTATLPEPYRKNPANCLAVVMQAAQWRMNPFAVAQKSHFVNGAIGYEAQLVAAAINQSSATKDNFHFDWYGDWSKILGKFKVVESKTKTDDNGYAKKFKFPAWEAKDEEGLGIKVWATLKGEDEPRVLDLLLTQANTRNSTLWADDPRQQLAYLAQKRWARLYTPGVILGVYTIDEVQEFGAAEKDVTAEGSHQTKAPEPQPPKHFTDEEFAVLQTKFKGYVDKGKPMDDIYTFIESKGTLLTQEQKDLMASWRAPIEGELVDDDFVTQMNQAESEQ